jgi:hypothetical protein
MNKEAYRCLDKEEIITKDHYWFDWQNNKFVLIPSNYPCIGKKAGYLYIYEKISLEDFRILKDDEIVNKEHFYVWKDDDYCNFLIYRCYSRHQGSKTSDVRKKCNSLPEFNLYAKKTQFNFETLNILKDIQL